MKIETMVGGMLAALGIGNASSVIWANSGTETAVASASWLSVVIQTGSLGLIGYLIIYGFPKLHEAMIGERKSERDRFALALEKANEAHLVVLTRISEERRSERADFIGALRDQRESHIVEQRETRREMAEFRKLFNDTIGAFRTAVHDVKDVASVTVNKANTAMEVAKITGQSPQT